MSSLVSPCITFSNSCSSFFINSDGRVWSCGWNSHGQLGLGDTTDRNSPTLIPMSNVIAVSSGYTHSVFLTQDGKLWSVGSNQYGQTGVTNQSLQPQEVSKLKNISQVACGFYQTVCLDDQGLIWSFGSNDYGQLGHGDVAQRNIPEQVQGLRNIVLVACGGFHTLCLDSENSLWSFGENDFGQLGIGNQENQLQPVRISGFNQKIIQISCGYFHSVLLDDQGSVWSFGGNTNGQLGHEDWEQHEYGCKLRIGNRSSSSSCFCSLSL